MHAVLFLVLFLDRYRDLWHTWEEIEAAKQAKQAAWRATNAEQAAKQAAELARQRALYEDESLLVDVVRMLDGDGTID